MVQNHENYDASAIQILEGLEPVKRRPGMYTRTDSPLHLIQEALDNAVDEALAGHANEITIIAKPDNTVVIRDNGRGIPVGIIPEKGISAAEAVFTILHAGGKFDKASGNSAYAFAGGLHGVGVTVTNALSSSLRVKIQREGFEWNLEFADGNVVSPLTQGKKSKQTGTELTITPNPKYFDNGNIPFDELKKLLKTKAVFLSNVKISFIDECQVPAVSETFFYEDGLVSYLTEIAGSNPILPIISGERYATVEEEMFAEGEGAIWAFSWYDDEGKGESFVNMIPTPMHGTHVNGFRSALFNGIKSYIDHHGMLPKGIKLSADDVFKHVKFVLSAKVLDPTFDNQTKDRLSSRDAVKLLEKMVLAQFEPWLLKNPALAKIIAEMSIRSAQARQKASNKVEKKKYNSAIILPGKLSDCESDNAEETELFLVEGDSAGGTAKLARNKFNQAILPMRGKSLNVWEKVAAEALLNSEINDITTAVGVVPHTLKETIDWSKLRYQKICILADADVDGFHIQVLLLTLFYRHFPQLIERGYVYVACPPLYRINVDGSAKKKQAKKIYVMNEQESLLTQDKLKREGYSRWTINRFKGLGEMSPEDLWETTLNPDTRTLKKVMLPDDMRDETFELFDNLMNKGKASWRKDWMERRGDEVDEY